METMEFKDNDGLKEKEDVSFDEDSRTKLTDKDELNIDQLFYGQHEMQVTEGEEAELRKHYENCTKNPGHDRFIPVKDFRMEHLPESFHDVYILDFIRTTAELALRVNVKFVSPMRQEHWPGTNFGYPFYESRSSDATRTGSGWVSRVSRYTKQSYSGTCPCRKCQKSDTPSELWLKVGVHTARHVVFDDGEAGHTTCRLFYDDEASPLVTLDGWTVVEADTSDDMCLLECATCDADIVNRLDKIYRRWHSLWYQVYNKYENTRDVEKLNFIVSHPHGCAKQISVGHWTNRNVQRFERTARTKYVYTTCTCPGSSGAHVEILGCDNGWTHGHIHSGVNSNGENFSGTGRHWI